MKKILLLACLCAFGAHSQVVGISTFATGIPSPTAIEHAGDSRLFVVQQSGAIKIVNENGTVNPVNFLTLGTSVISTGGERGLLGLAFHPEYADNGYFYVNYTRAGDGDTVIARYQVSSNPDVADPSSGTILMIIDQPYANHNGGTIRFGPDGYLFIGTGDGGSGGDPGNRAQNINENLGKMLRIDVNSGAPYGIPATNPFVNTEGNDEIYAIGLRNPWKFSFDRANGDLWIADVGQNQVEEINHVPSEVPGLNYGWKCYEGNSVYSTCTNPPAFTFPGAQYTHSGTGGCSVTGGYVYNGSMYPNFLGKFFFADYCINKIGYVDEAENITWSNTFAGNNSFMTFGENVDGELFVCASNGNIYRVVDTSLGVNSSAKSAFTLYPNPADGEVFIQSNPEMQLTSYSVRDLQGKLLMERRIGASDLYSIKTGGLASGVYLVTVENTAGETHTSRLTVK